MVRRTAYEVNNALGEEKKSWYRLYGEDSKKAGYAGAKVRTANIVGPSRELISAKFKKAA